MSCGKHSIFLVDGGVLESRKCGLTLDRFEFQCRMFGFYSRVGDLKFELFVNRIEVPFHETFQQCSL